MTTTTPRNAKPTPTNKQTNEQTPVPILPRPPAGFTFYVYSDGSDEFFATPASTPEEAWANVQQMIVDSYTPGNPNEVGGGLVEYWGYEPTAAEIDAAIREDLARWTTLLQVHCASSEEAFRWWTRNAGDARASLREEWAEVFPDGAEARH